MSGLAGGGAHGGGELRGIAELQRDRRAGRLLEGLDMAGLDVVGEGAAEGADDQLLGLARDGEGQRRPGWRPTRTTKRWRMCVPSRVQGPALCAAFARIDGAALAEEEHDMAQFIFQER